jgi:ABC-type multidrug transport system permease subunit
MSNAAGTVAISPATRSRHPLLELTFARMREFIREPEAVFWTFGYPIIMSLALAFAFPSADAQTTLVGVATGDAAAGIRKTLAATPRVTVRDVAPGDAQRMLREGAIHVLVEATDPPTYRFDAARAESRTAQLVVDDALKRAAGRTDPWTAREQPVVVPGSRYIDWLIPGIIGTGLMANGMWGVGFSIVQARMRKVLKRMVASPMRRHHYLLAQLLARLVILVPEVAVPLMFGALAFGMPINGSIPAIAIVVLLGALAFSALGLLFGTRARTFEGISGLMNIGMLPMWVLSGVFFSASNFPDPIQPFVQALPLTALNDALRAVILEGSPLRAVADELLLLGAWIVIPFAVSLKIFRWQ